MNIPKPNPRFPKPFSEVVHKTGNQIVRYPKKATVPSTILPVVPHLRRTSSTVFSEDVELALPNYPLKLKDDKPEEEAIHPIEIEEIWEQVGASKSIKPKDIDPPTTLFDHAHPNIYTAIQPKVTKKERRNVGKKQKPKMGINSLSSAIITCSFDGSPTLLPIKLTEKQEKRKHVPSSHTSSNDLIVLPESEDADLTGEDLTPDYLSLSRNAICFIVLFAMICEVGLQHMEIFPGLKTGSPWGNTFLFIN